MKNKVSFAIFFWLGILSTILVFQSHTKITKPDSIKSFLKKMHFIEGAEFACGLTDFFRMRERDKTLLFSISATRKEVSSFYISATEVTNAEYWEFYSAMVDEFGYEKAMESYYPDTLAWIKQVGYSYNEPMTRNYHLHPNYDNYPVVGISWIQAQAYCRWKTQQFKSLVGEQGESLGLTFRLPTQYEWEHAALGPLASRESGGMTRYPWDGYEYKKNGKYLANFGSIFDINRVKIKGSTDDGGLFTTVVGKYPSNLNGLYDMAGNVAEWVSDTAKILSWVDNEMIYKESDIDNMLEEFEKRIVLNKGEVDYTNLKKKLEHDKEILLKGDMRIIKGGSWYDGLAYLQIGSQEAMDKDKKSARVGFRVAISYNKKYEKYFSKKHWQPKKK